MRVDGTHGLEPHGLTEPNGCLPRGARAGGQARGGQPSDSVEVLSSQTRYIQLARDVEEVDVPAVAEAKELLRSGRLDTPEAARRAAEAIVTLRL